MEQVDPSKEQSLQTKRRWAFAATLVFCVMGLCIMPLLEGRDVVIGSSVTLVQAALLTTFIPGLLSQEQRRHVASFAHIGFNAATGLIPLLARSSLLLGEYLLVMTFAMASRRILGGCALRSLDGRHRWPECEWSDYVFPITSAVAIARLTLQAWGKSSCGPGTSSPSQR